MAQDFIYTVEERDGRVTDDGRFVLEHLLGRVLSLTMIEILAEEQIWCET